MPRILARINAANVQSGLACLRRKVAPVGQDERARFAPVLVPQGGVHAAADAAGQQDRGPAAPPMEPGHRLVLTTAVDQAGKSPSRSFS